MVITKAHIDKLLRHFRKNGWISATEEVEIREHFNQRREEDRLDIFEIEAVVDIEYQICSLNYALTAMGM